MNEENEAMPESVPEDAAEKTPETVPESASENVPEKFAEDAAEKTPETVPESEPEVPRKKRKYTKHKKEVKETVPEPAESLPAEEKSVEEMLKEEGVIKETEERAPEKEDAINLKETLMRIEKMDAQITALKDVKFQADERIKELAESIGELRSMIFQMDGEVDKTVTKVEKLEDMISDVKPEKISKELQKKDEDLEKNRAEIERLDKMSHDLLKKMESVQKILDNIKSMENLIEVTKGIETRLAKMEELNEDSKRSAGKIEKFYLDMDRKLSEVGVLESRMLKVEDLSKELMETNDDLSIQIKNLITREDVQNIIKEMVHVPELSNVDELMNQKKEIESLLKNMDEQFKAGIISKESYDEISDKNGTILEQLDEKLKQSDLGEKPRDLQTWLGSISESMRNVETRLKLNDEKVNKVEADFRHLAEKKAAGKPRANIIEAPEKDMPKQESNIEIDEIESFLTSLEDEYRKGLVSEDTYREVRQRNLEKLKSLENIVAVPARAEKAVNNISEIKKLKGKLAVLKTKGMDMSELEACIEKAEKRDTMGYSSIAKIYLDHVRDRLIDYE